MRKKTIIIQVLLFGMLLGMFFYGFHSADQGLDQEDVRRVKQAVQKAALECYSIEGSYPTDIQYLKQHYGLYIQEEKYLIRYHYIGANIMPDTDVYPRSKRYASENFD